MLDDRVSAELFRVHSKRLYNTALRITQSEDEAEEVMQETLIRYIAGSVAGLRPGSGKKQTWAWLRTTAVHLSIDCLRSRKRFVRLDECADEPDAFGNPDWPDGDDGFWDGLDGSLIGIVMAEMGKLPDGYRTILVLRLVEGYDYSEIAKILNISESGVRSPFMRGRRRVAERVRLRMDSESGIQGAV